MAVGVYNMCVSYLYRSNVRDGMAAVSPITNPLCTGRSISDIAWIPPLASSGQEMSEIAVAFTYHSEVHIYDLSLNNQLVCVLTLGGDRGRGNSSLLARSPPTASIANSVDVYAGSTYGQIRMWTVTEASRFSDAHISPVWEVSGDHLSRSGTHSCIVGLRAVSSRPAWVLSMTRMGVLAVWDTENIRSASFMSLRSPVCVLRVCLWDSSLPSSPRAPSSDICTGCRPILPPQSSMVVGISSPPVTSSCLGCDTMQSPVSDHICVTLSSGEIFMFDYMAGRLTTFPVNSAASDVSCHQASRGGQVHGSGLCVSASGDTVENIQPRGRAAPAGDVDGVVVAGSSLSTRDVRCPAVFCETTGNEVSLFTILYVHATAITRIVLLWSSPLSVCLFFYVVDLLLGLSGVRQCGDISPGNF